jgi:alpha-L-fucosidase
MKEKIIIGLLFFLLFISGCGQSTQKDGIPVAPKQNRRPENFQPINYKYSLEDLKENFSGKMMQLAAKQYEIVNDVNNKGKWKPTPESIDSHQTPEWFKDAKFGMFIDWGLWSVAGWAPKNEKKPMYPDWYESNMYTDSATIKYHEKNWGKDFKRDDFFPLFTAGEYNPEKLAKLAVEAGMKYIVPFCKHHGGFCLWPSSFTQRDVGDMGPRKDLIKPLVESCKEQGLKFGFYFSLEEWEYPLINGEGNLVNRKWGGKTELYSKEFEKKSSGKIAVKNFAEDYIVPQATEFIDKYDPDIIWYDGEWSTSVYDLHSYDIAAYFYNKAQGRKEVAVNDRYGVETDGKWLRFKRGDFFTSEYNDHKDNNKTHTWEECRGISQSFGYNWQDSEDNVISSEEFIKMFVDIVSHGGNLLLIVNLDGQGALPVIEENRLRDIGKWLKVNGEGIYGTRTYSTTSEGDVRYTCGKNNQIVYAITTIWPGDKLELKSVVPKSGSKIYLLGKEEPLKWSYDHIKGLTNILIPDNLQKDVNRPCKYAYTFRIEI